MKKSHRDQKTRPYATKAIEHGCDILEIDVQSACGVIVLGHNWRPKLPFLFDCTLADYMKRVPPGTFIQLDIKEICFTEWGRKRFAQRVITIIQDYPNLFLVGANKGLFRERTAKAISCMDWKKWSADKTIEVVDLYE